MNSQRYRGRKIRDLAKLTDELMLALPAGLTTLTPALEQRFDEIVGPLSKEDWVRLWAVFVPRHMPDHAKRILAS